MPIKYRARATATGGRDGHSRTDDGKIDVRLAVPTELGGPGGDATNPEQLFATGYSACFLGAVRFVAGKEKVRIADDASVTATVGIGPRDDGGGFGLEVDLEVKLPGVERAVAQDLIDKANIVCPYSHATKGNIPVRLTLA